MKRFILMSALFFSLQIFAMPSSVILPSLPITMHAPVAGKSLSKEQLARIASIKLKEVEKLSGKKLTIKEKIAFKIFQQKIKKQARAADEPDSKKGKTAFILGIIALALIFVPYGFIASVVLAILALTMGYSARKINPEDKKAKTAIVLGWVALGLIALFVILAAAFFAAYAGLF